MEIRLQPSIRVLFVLFVREHPESKCFAGESETKHFLIQTALRSQWKRGPSDRWLHVDQRNLPWHKTGRVSFRQLPILHGPNRSGHESAFQQ
jgi:hypothetical protein